MWKMERNFLINLSTYFIEDTSVMFYDLYIFCKNRQMVTRCIALYFQT